MSGSVSFSAGMISGLFLGHHRHRSMLATLYGSATSATNALGQNPVTALQQAEQNETQDVKATAGTTGGARDIAAFATAVQTATSPQQLLSNPAAMGAADRPGWPINCPTRAAQKALLSNVSDASFARPTPCRTHVEGGGADL